MTEERQQTSFSRREFLKLSAGAALTLTVISKTALLTGCTPQVPASTYRILRDSDLPMLRAVFPHVIGAHPAFDVNKAINALDYILAHSSERMQKEALQLFELLTFPLSRATLAGVWTDWSNTSHQDIEQFLLRWRDSRLRLLRFGYQGLNQLLVMAWYGVPESWSVTGYSGPPQLRPLSP